MRLTIRASDNAQHVNGWLRRSMVRPTTV